MTASAPPAARSLLLPQIRFENRLFWRTPIAAFFTLIFPLMFLLLFSVIFGENDTIDLGPRGVFTIAQFYAPALGVFGVASATYTNVGTSTALARDEGILKRFLGTPLPAWAYLVGKIGSAIWVGLLAMVLMMTIGAVVFDVPIYPGRLPAAAVTFLLGALSFAMLGLMVAALAPSGDSAPAITNATLLPIAFVSEIFIITTDGPGWMEVLGNVFPLKHFVRAFQDAFSPIVTDSAVRWHHWAVLFAWGVGAGLIALRFFSWDPKEGRRRRRRREAATD